MHPEKRRQNYEYVHDILFWLIKSLLIQGLILYRVGVLKYLLVLLVHVVNREQAILVQLLNVGLPLALFVLLKLCLVHSCLEKH